MPCPLSQILTGISAKRGGLFHLTEPIGGTITLERYRLLNEGAVLIEQVMLHCAYTVGGHAHASLHCSFGRLLAPAKIS